MYPQNRSTINDKLTTTRFLRPPSCWADQRIPLLYPCQSAKSVSIRVPLSVIINQRSTINYAHFASAVLLGGSTNSFAQSVPIRQIRVNPCSIICYYQSTINYKLRALCVRRLVGRINEFLCSIRANPLNPCQSVFYYIPLKSINNKLTTTRLLRPPSCWADQRIPLLFP